MLESRQTAPNFSLPDQDGVVQSLADHKGETVLVYFYPMDDTPGCTKEACTIAEMYNEFENNGVKVFGISPDSIESHKAFAEKYHLPFRLLSDPEFQAIKSYGAFQEKEATEHGAHTKRISYLISPDGVIIRTYPDVDPATHALEILKEVKGIA